MTMLLFDIKRVDLKKARELSKEGGIIAAYTMLRDADYSVGGAMFEVIKSRMLGIDEIEKHFSLNGERVYLPKFELYGVCFEISERDGENVVAEHVSGAR